MNLRRWSALGLGAITLVFSSAVYAQSAPSSALSGGPGEHESQPLVGHDRGGPVSQVYDRGAPDLTGGNEMTNWSQADAFVLSDTVELTSCRFWTLDFQAWDGGCQYGIYENAGGVPGVLLYSGAVSITRAATGRVLSGAPEFVNFFSFPNGTVLGAGTYFLALHMSFDCGTRDNIYWEYSAGPGDTAEDLGCDGGWGGYGLRRAFVLFGNSECPPPPQATNGYPDNVEDVSLTPTLTWNNPGCDAILDVINGGFEAGNFTGWGIVTGPGGDLIPWTVAMSGGYFGDSTPAQGSFFAVNGFDGDAGKYYEAYQEVYVPVGASNAAIEWQDRIRWDGLGISSAQPRTYRVTVQPSGGGSPIETLHAFDFFLHSGGSTVTGDTGYVYHSESLAQYQGQTVRIVWRQDIPETFTGPATYQLDAVQFGCPIFARPAVTPATAKAFDESFEQSVARYESAKTAALARPTVTHPAAASVNADEREPLSIDPIDRGGAPCGVLFGAATGNGPGGGEAPSNLYQIDPATGAASLIGPIGFDGVTGMSFHPITGVLYASCNADNIYGTSSSALITINPLTGAGTLIGRITGGANRFPDISFGPNGVLYGYGDFGTEGLYTIDLGTGAGTLVGVSGTGGGGNGMDFAPNGDLYQTAWDDGCLHQLDINTGASSCVAGTAGTLPAGGSSNNINALDFNLGDGRLYASIRIEGVSNLGIVHLGGGFSIIGQSVAGLDAIAFRCRLEPCNEFFNAGAPNLADAWEMTTYIEADDFIVFDNTRMTGGRFWTLDTGNWDGTLEYFIYSSAGGTPGSLITQGLASSVDRQVTGRSNFGLTEREWRFEFPAPGILLPPGTYWLGLHASSDCASFEAIYWENSAVGFGANSVGSGNCSGVWDIATGAQRAFQLCGQVESGCCGALYGAATPGGSGSGPSTLFLIDPLSGAGVPIGPIGFNGVSGISVDGNGRMFGSCNADNIFGTVSAGLIRINPLTGAGTLIGKIGDSSSSAGRFTDLSFASNGTLYGYGDFGAEGLYTINTITGAGTYVGFSGTFGGGNGMDFANDGRLYGTATDNNCLHEINPANGSSTCVPGTEGTIPSRINALEFCKNTGVLYASYNSKGSQLGTIDPVLGGFQSIGSTIDGLDAIAFRCPPVLCPMECYVYLTNNTGSFDVYPVGTATSFNPPRLYCNSIYAWAVECIGPGGSNFSNTWFFETGEACPPGDANADGVVNFSDITAVLTFWLFDYDGPGVQRPETAGGDPFNEPTRGGFLYPGSGPGDANCDGDVNFADITKVLENWLFSCLPATE